MQTDLVPVHDTHLGKFNTANGHIIDLNHPEESNICIQDIKVALSNICRFGGQIKNYYSVAQHSILVMHLAPAEIKREALMHDAAEAYLGDVIKPLKNMLGRDYAEMEKLFMLEICDLFDLNACNLERVKPYDMQALELEHEALQKGNVMPLMVEMNKHRMLDDQPHCFWDCKTARKEFYNHYVELFKPNIK